MGSEKLFLPDFPQTKSSNVTLQFTSLGYEDKRKGKEGTKRRQNSAVMQILCSSGGDVLVKDDKKGRDYFDPQPQ